MIVDLAIDREIIKLEARKPEQLASLVVGQRAGAVAFDGEPIERLAARIGVLGDIVWKLDSDLYESRIARFARDT